MADFPEIASKLSVPSKKSHFERQRAEAEAKKAREKAETAAVLAEFERSFDDDEENAFPPQGISRGAPAPGKRHFTSTGLKSGPGSLPRSGPGSLGPAFNKKRAFDDFAERRDRGGAFAPDRRTSRDEEEAERDDEKAARPTLHLASMPPATTPSFIRGLFAHTPLNVDNVRILPPPSQAASQPERRSCAAIVTLAAETPASDIDTVVSHLQNKYLGFGFKLSISRHLSSAAIGASALTSSNINALPFGARQIHQQTSLSRAPPPGQRFAPPQSYTSSTPYSRGPPSQVTVQSPSDLKQLKLIHKTLEALLTYGPEFEALLMSRAEIQRDERWSWLWDSSSVGGVYYRWRLWEVLTNASNRRRLRGAGTEVIFEGQSVWQPPEEPLRFEYTMHLDELVSDEDYNSSDDESDDGRGEDLSRRYNDHKVSGVSTVDDAANDGMGYLNPLAKAKLTHLLTRLPESNARLRRGDVARLTAFAIEHAGSGGDEVAMLITRNVVQPFCKPQGDDHTSASMVGLYVISDILSCSASAGVRHAWRYRTLFEASLRQQKVFEKLGRAEKDLKWGKLKGDKWKRSVQNVLSLWEGWSVFPHAAQEEFTEKFLNPPLTEEERVAVAEAEAEASKKADADEQKKKSLNKWRTVDEDASPDVKMEDFDGTPMDDDEDQALDSGLENLDGMSMVDSSDDEAALVRKAELDTASEPQPVAASDLGQEGTASPVSGATPAVPATAITSSGARRKRPKAADMFADESE